MLLAAHKAFANWNYVVELAAALYIFTHSVTFQSTLLKTEGGVNRLTWCITAISAKACSLVSVLSNISCRDSRHNDADFRVLLPA